MNTKTYYHIADIIQRNRKWIKVVDTERLVEMRIIQDGNLRTLYYRSLTLQSFREHENIQRKRMWKISEYDIGQGLASLCRKDPTNRMLSLFLMLSILLKLLHLALLD